MTVTCRPALPNDELFLRSLIKGTVSAELGAEFWPESLRTHLLAIQYDSRRQSIGTAFPRAADQIVLADGESIGWFVVDESAGEIRMVELMLVPAWRGRGAGTILIRQVLARGCVAGKPVRLSVVPSNAGAIRLYQRLGFQSTGGDESRLHMQAGSA